MPQQTHTFETQITKQVRLKYLLYLPRGYGDNPHERWPLILFLHGKDERGDDLERVKQHGIPKLIEQGKDFPFVMISPQCPAESRWQFEYEGIAALLEEILVQRAIDPARVYLTGLSMGGYGVWWLAMLYPARFAAVAPICGGGIPGEAHRLKHLPVWAFHGADDDLVPLSESERMVNALRAVEGNVRFTVYPGVKHDSWTQTYENPQLYEWFLAQHRRGD